MFSLFRRPRRLASAPDLAPLDRTPVDRLFEAGTLALILVDAISGRVVRLNPKAAARFGYDGAAPSDLRVERLLPDLPVVLASRARRGVRAALGAPFTIRATPRTGAEFPVEVTLMRIAVPGDAEPQLLLLVRDRAPAYLAPRLAHQIPRPTALAA